MTDLNKPVRMRCYRCKRTTLWEPGRGGKFSKCSECGDRFPCPKKADGSTCRHLDCKSEREERKRGASE